MTEEANCKRAVCRTLERKEFQEKRSSQVGCGKLNKNTEKCSFFSSSAQRGATSQALILYPKAVKTAPTSKHVGTQYFNIDEFPKVCFVWA